MLAVWQREKFFEAVTRHASLHHLDDEPLHVGLVLRKLHIAHCSRDDDGIIHRPRRRLVPDELEFPRKCCRRSSMDYFFLSLLLERLLNHMAWGARSGMGRRL